MEQEALIQKYIQDSLNETEQQQFDTLLASDADFAKQVAEAENLHKAIKASEKDVLKSRLQELEATDAELDVSKTRKSRNIRFAIAIVLLLGFGLLGNYFIQQANFHETLYATYFEPYPNALQPVTRGELQTDLLSEATQAYEAKDYEKANATFDLVLAGQDNPNVEVLFYKAMSLLNLKKETEALDILRSIKHTETRFTPQIYWYGTLIHIKFKEYEKSLKALAYMDKIQTTFKAKERAALKEKLQ